MYKYLLCWRYLRTRYIALASIISVMLGVATMIVVNSVMAGFAHTMRERLHGVLADIQVSAEYDMNGFYNADEVMARINEVAGDRVEAMSPAMETFGLLQFEYGGQIIPRQVQIFGIDPAQRARTGDFAQYIKDEKERTLPPSLDVSEEFRLKSAPAGQLMLQEGGDPAVLEALKEMAHKEVPDRGAIIGWAIGSVHRHGKDEFVIRRGDKIRLIYPRGGQKPEPGADDFTVMGYFKSNMSENDSMHVYVPLDRFQYVRQMIDEDTKRGAVNTIQVKVKPGVDLDVVRADIQGALERLRPMYFKVSTWELMQGPLLSAVAVEQSILNMLLFFIIAVAGFGILAIFSMIVVEKTRDIGIMKALGASTSGVRGIFLGYGLLLGAVGSGVGMAGGLTFVHYINDIEKWLSRVTGHKVFDDSIYYFNQIPTLVEPWTVCWIVAGAIFIAAAASVWPAQRAARLHPVRALRFE